MTGGRAERGGRTPRTGRRWPALAAAVLAVLAAVPMLTGASAQASQVRGQAGVPAGGANPLAAARNLVGSAVAIDGGTAVVGAPGVNFDTGVAWVYIRSGGTWKKRATIADPRDAQGDYFAAEAAIATVKSVTYLVIGDATGNIVYIYTGSGAKWRLRQTIKDPGNSSTDAFGAALAIAGTTLAIGSPGVGYDFGDVYVYALSGAKWALRSRLVDPKGKPLDLFGRSLTIDGSIMLIGAVDVSYAYTESAARRWSRSATIPNPGGAKDNFGAAVAAVGTTAVIGAPGDVPGPFTLSPGAAYVYTRGKSGAWTRRQTIPVPGKGDFFGYSAVMAGSRMLIGMPWYGGNTCGAVFEYRPSGGSWKEDDRLVPAGCAGGDQFGDTLALAGTTAVIGAPYENVQVGAFYIRSVR
jgi:hypothetical protein